MNITVIKLLLKQGLLQEGPHFYYSDSAISSQRIPNRMVPSLMMMGSSRVNQEPRS